MTVQTLHIPLPEAIVQRLQRVAEGTHRPLEEVGRANHLWQFATNPRRPESCIAGGRR